MGQETADWLYDLANLAAVIGGVLVVLGAAGIFWVGGIRESFTDKRIAFAEVETARANEAAAISQKANTQLQLDLEREKKERIKIEERIAPRRLSGADKKKLISSLVPYVNQPIYFGVPKNNQEGDDC